MNIVICDTAGDEVTVAYVICDDGQLCSSLPLTATDLLVSTAANEVTASEVGTILLRKTNCFFFQVQYYFIYLYGQFYYCVMNNDILTALKMQEVDSSLCSN